VIVGAGSAGSTRILQPSGIGAAPLPQRRAIASMHELPGVGGNLQDRLQLRMGLKVRDVLTLDELANSRLGKATMALE
jgi:choline dehydrogenase